MTYLYLLELLSHPSRLGYQRCVEACGPASLGSRSRDRLDWKFTRKALARELRAIGSVASLPWRGGHSTVGTGYKDIPLTSFQ